MKKRVLRYGGMLLGAAEKKAINRVVNKNWWPSGPETKKMEAEAAAYLGMKYGVLANSGSSAGLLALAALELRPGDEVLIPATTFPTIFNIIPQLGLVPVVIDSKVGTYNLDPEEIEAALSPLTKAIICIHAVGNPCNMPRIMEIAAKHNLYVLEDNCDGWGASFGRKKVGSYGHITFTSFHAAHIVSMGQGGGVFTNDEKLARNARMYRDWGRQADLTGRTNSKWPTLPNDYDNRFIYEKLGWNLSPLELQAAMGLVQLRRTERIKKLRRRNFDYLYKHLERFEDFGLQLPLVDDKADPSWFAFPLSYEKRGEIVAHLEKWGIETRSMFAGNILAHPAYKNVTHRVGGDLSGANYILKHSFWLGCHPSWSMDDLKYVIWVFTKYFDSYA